VLAATADAEQVAGEIFNVACGGSITLNALVSEINGLLGTELAATYEAERVGDVRHSRADISKAKRQLKYQPEVTFSEGLKRTLEWYASAPREAVPMRKAS